MKLQQALPLIDIALHLHAVDVGSGSLDECIIALDDFNCRHLDRDAYDLMMRLMDDRAKQLDKDAGIQ